MTAPHILEHSLTPAEGADLPPLHRLLTPDEFHAAQLLSPEALSQPGMFPLMATLPKPTALAVKPDATATKPATGMAQPSIGAGPAPQEPSIGADPSAAIPQHGHLYNAVWDVAQYGDAVTRGFIDDVIHKPARAAVNLVPEGAIISAGMDALKQSAKGNQPGAAMTALAAAPFLAAPLSEAGVTYLSRMRQAWTGMFQHAEEGDLARGIIRATTGKMSAEYEQAAFKLDEFRRIINPLPEEQKLAFIDLIESGQEPTKEALASVGAEIKGRGPRNPTPSAAPDAPLPTSIESSAVAHPSSDAARASARPEPTDMAIPMESDVSPHRQRMAKINGAMAARAGDAATLNPYKPDSPLFAAWNEGHAGVPPEDFGANNVLREHAQGLSPEDIKQIHADLGEERQIAAAAKAADAQPAPEVQPGFRELASTIRATLDDARGRIQALGTGKLDHFIEDYFPHIWEDPERAADVWRSVGAKANLEGPASFLKQRTIPTTREGIEQGLKPVTTNPIDLTLLKLREMNRYLMAHESLNQLKDADLVRYVKAGDVIPDGYQRINDKVATVFGPRQGAVSVPKDAVHATSGATVEGPGMAPVSPDEINVYGRRIMGEYWAPAPVAGVVNNYLSPGLPTTLQNMFPGPRGRMAAMAFEAYRGLGNTLNQAQLGFSAFHLGFTSLDAATSRTALGIEHLASGHPIEGIKNIITAPLAALPGIVAGLNHTFGGESQFGLGAKIRAAYLNPESASPEMRTLAQYVQEAGGRIGPDSFYQGRLSAISRINEAWANNDYFKTGRLLLPSLLELSSKPIMEHIVPLQKLQVFGELAQKVMGDMPPDASVAERRAALQNAWDSVDNRMGQLVYDNLFWNKTFKDLAMASTRSVGWNLGTIRELGGGLADYGKALAVDPQMELTHRAAYVAALPLTVGTLGAAYQYLRTGQGPQELKDYFFPRTGDTDADGNPERVQLPSYMKDLFAYAGHPYATVTHKMSPLPSMVVEMLSNNDFYGDQIRNPHDPLVQQLQQEAEYIGKTVLPFGYRNAMEQRQRGDDLTTQISSGFGITPAKREDVRTPAENLMHDYMKEKGSGGATPEMQQTRQERGAILAGLRSGNDEATQAAITKALEHGNITPPQLARLLKRAGLTPDQERFKALPLDEALNVWKIAQPREQAKFAEILAKKVERASK